MCAASKVDDELPDMCLVCHPHVGAAAAVLLSVRPSGGARCPSGTWQRCKALLFSGGIVEGHT